MSEIKEADVVNLLKLECAYDHADVVLSLIQQRDELLKALKKCRFDSLNMSINDWKYIQTVVQKAGQ